MAVVARVVSRPKTISRMAVLIVSHLDCLTSTLDQDPNKLLRCRAKLLDVRSRSYFCSCRAHGYLLHHAA